MQAAGRLEYEIPDFDSRNLGFDESLEQKKLKEEKLRLVKNKHYRLNFTKKMMFKCLFLAAILFVTAIGFTAYETSIKYQINKTNNEIAKVQNEIENLNLQITTNMSPSVIEQKAIDELGMEYPAANQYVYIDAQKDEIASSGQ